MTPETQQDSIQAVTRTASSGGHVTYELRTADLWITVSGSAEHPALVDGARAHNGTPTAVLPAPLRTLGELLLQAEGEPESLPAFWYELASTVEGVMDTRVEVVELDDELTQDLWWSPIRYTIWAHVYPDGTIRLRTLHAETGRYRRFQKTEITHGLFHTPWTMPTVVLDLLEVTGLRDDLEKPVGASFGAIAELVDYLTAELELDLEPVA